jgi:hypothetical protein
METRPGATELRVFVYDTIAKRGRPPASTEIGAHFGITPDDARIAVADARLGKTLFPDPHTGEIAIAGPVAGAPTPYRVMANGVTWFANSAWDMLGVAAMFMTDVTIETRCTDCGDPVKMFLEPYSFPAFRFPKTAPADQNLIVHFMMPARQWQDDIAATCNTMSLFQNDDHLTRWLTARKYQKGAVVGIEQVWRLAMAWYHDPRDPSWRPTTKEEQQAVLESVGLRGAFWRF